jgi:uncharacterized membrane protein
VRIPPGSLGRLAMGAAYGLGGAGLLAGHFRLPAPAGLYVVGALAGALAALLAPAVEALRHPPLAAGAAACGLLMAWLPEPTFYLLVPLLVAAAAWPVRPPGVRESIPRAVPGWVVPAVFAAASLLFFVQSANRYWGYGAGAKDLGLFYQTHWLIAHGLPPMNTVMGMHALADHMELLDWAVAPLLRVYEGPETLLLVQAVALASAVFPLFWMGRRVLESSRAGLTLAGAWLLAPDMHLGLMFDYNPTQLGAAALLWSAWAMACRGLPAALGVALIACLSKENTCLYLAVVAAVLGLRVAPRRNALAVLALALGLFAAEMTLVFPRFREGGFRHWEYEELGDTPAETAAAAATRPDRTLSLLVNHPQKRRSLLLPLLATGYVGVADPLSVVLQLPNWAERLLSTHRTRWWGYHYGVPAAATACLGLMLGWRRLRIANRDGRDLPRYVIGCALVAGLLPPFRTPAGNARSDLYVPRQPYVAASEDVRTQQAAVAFIGRSPHVKVAAQDRLLPRLAGRPHIYMLDRALEADMVALQLNGATWPEGRPSWRRRVQHIWGSRRFAVAFCEGQTVVLTRGAPPGLPCRALDVVLARAEEYEREKGGS